ncbi:hypothetical protein [uncultured Polaribacter sp.]|uniref:hypothetical protein n=1 Tax=uncultured Polaribacter sp. TaxID=174711 RepID=UPI00262710C6|nr:hypothetical protein [uncultured Polaribacter sp.]
MKKFIIGFIISLLLTNSGYSQVTKKDSIEAFKKLNKWAVVKLTIAYMEDLRDWSSKTDKKRFNTNQKIEWETYKKLNDEYSELRIAVNLDSVSKYLSKGWVKTRDEVFKSYKLELIDSVKSIHFKNIIFNPEKTKIVSNRTKVIEGINKHYDKLIAKKHTILSSSRQKIMNPKNLENRSIIHKVGIDWGQMTLYVLLVISILLNVFLIKLKSKKKVKDNVKEKKQNLESFYKSENKTLKEKNKNLINEINQLKTKKTSTVEKNNLVRNRKTQVEKSLEFQQPIEEAKPITVAFENSEIKKKFIYFPSPFEERRFAIEDASEIEKPTSLYVVKVDDNVNRGSISLIGTADLSRALNSPNIYLETVCEYENAYNSEAKGINVIEEGEVVFEGEDWVVKSKIKIKFI